VCFNVCHYDFIIIDVVLVVLLNLYHHHVNVLELLHTHLGFIFPKVFPCLLVIISHYPVSYILGENIPPGEYSLSVDTSV
jgi:bacteriorhodopsin